MVTEGDAGMTLGDIVTDNARRFPDVPAYRLGERVVTHQALRELAVRLVSAMVGAGVRRQDRVAVLGRNSIEFGEVLAATQLSGIIMATINFRMSRREVRDALQRVTPSIVFCDDEFAPMINELASDLPGLPLLVSLAMPVLGYGIGTPGGVAGVWGGVKHTSGNAQIDLPAAALHETSLPFA